MGNTQGTSIRDFSPESQVQLLLTKPNINQTGLQDGYQLLIELPRLANFLFDLSLFSIVENTRVYEAWDGGSIPPRGTKI